MSEDLFFSDTLEAAKRFFNKVFAQVKKHVTALPEASIVLFGT
jgi:hypothetical protein